MLFHKKIFLSLVLIGGFVTAGLDATRFTISSEVGELVFGASGTLLLVSNGNNVLSVPCDDQGVAEVSCVVVHTVLGSVSGVTIAMKFIDEQGAQEQVTFDVTQNCSVETDSHYDIRLVQNVLGKYELSITEDISIVQPYDGCSCALAGYGTGSVDDIVTRHTSLPRALQWHPE